MINQPAYLPELFYLYILQSWNVSVAFTSDLQAMSQSLKIFVLLYRP